jgi:DNA-binding MarR family transcriptional regulator
MYLLGMNGTERDRLVEALTASSAALVGIAVRSVAAGPADVTVAQHRVLALLDEHGAATVTTLADHLGVDQSNASRHCSRLARLGLVDRTPAAHDGRAVEVRLTRAGRQQVRAVRDARRHELERVLDGLTDPEVRDVARAFELFHHAATRVLT